ncbi:excreted virulence factor EspC (type VII ESX diderm) [Tamaricihabitans halophyticus]|uniref:Excreted virulence factor EspC (Type VII ESX diderm) n=1 Tax=Tamaricihabitans halophyticus TaxID=1262583 RepID=A0A4R2R4B2_9PSEU|nr:type VII secretion target [Tamaricihabitans halophyticus]TCP57413.1 excreted virulence factor EspC (type VII ESX diderm) [Tamaricihabitans halophyticus]
MSSAAGGGNFDVSTEEMRTHAGKVTGVGERLGTAASAAKQTTLNTEAFGLIGQFLVPGVLAVSGAATLAIGAAKTSAENLAESVKGAAEDYDQTEESNAKPFEKGY